MGHRTRVLVVDDNAQLRNALGTLLGANDSFEVVGTAKDGEEAIELAKSHRPDVVLMDIRMPVMDGVEATRRILSAMTGVTIVAHSAYDDAELVAEMVRAGARGYLVKGVTADELFDGLASAMQGEARISASATRGLFEEVTRRDGTDAGEAEAMAAVVSAQLRSDGLTGLLLRSVFQGELEQAVALAATTMSPLTVVVVRILGLRATNRQFGWEAGDALLRAVASQVTGAVGANGTVGRVDGDEIGAVLPGHDSVAGRRTVEAIRARLEASAPLEGCPLHAACAFAAFDSGISDDVDADSLLEAVRDAVHAAGSGEIRIAGDDPALPRSTP